MDKELGFYWSCLLEAHHRSSSESQSNPIKRTCDDTRVRNFKFKTEQDDLPGWTVVDGSDCYPPCSGVAGHCDYCGENGYCCSGKRHDINGDCTEEMITAIHQVNQILSFLGIFKIYVLSQFGLIQGIICALQSEQKKAVPIGHMKETGIAGIMTLKVPW